MTVDVPAGGIQRRRPVGQRRRSQPAAPPSQPTPLLCQAALQPCPQRLQRRAGATAHQHHHRHKRNTLTRSTLTVAARRLTGTTAAVSRSIRAARPPLPPHALRPSVSSLSRPSTRGFSCPYHGASPVAPPPPPLSHSLDAPHALSRCPARRLAPSRPSRPYPHGVSASPAGPGLN